MCFCLDDNMGLFVDECVAGWMAGPEDNGSRVTSDDSVLVWYFYFYFCFVFLIPCREYASPQCRHDIWRPPIAPYCVNVDA